MSMNDTWKSLKLEVLKMKYGKTVEIWSRMENMQH